MAKIRDLSWCHVSVCWIELESVLIILKDGKIYVNVKLIRMWIEVMRNRTSFPKICVQTPKSVEKKARKKCVSQKTFRAWNSWIHQIFIIVPLKNYVSSSLQFHYRPDSRNKNKILRWIRTNESYLVVQK